MEETQNNWKPKRWLATALSFFLGFSGLLYIGKGKLFLIYSLASLLILIAGFFTLNLATADLLNVLSMVSSAISIVCAIQTYRLCTNFQANKLRPWYSHWWGILGIYLMVVTPVFIFRSFFFEPFKIPAGSMAPTHVSGDYIIISKFGYGNYSAYGINLLQTTPTKKIQRGDVIVFSYPPQPKIDYVKRVIGLPGDLVSYKSKILSINNKAISLKAVGEYQQINQYAGVIKLKEYEESVDGISWHIIHLPETPTNDFETTVPPDSYFVMGDNRDNSSDSRVWGTVPAANIKGKVIYSVSDKK